MDNNKELFKTDKDGLYYLDNHEILTPFVFNELVKAYTPRRQFYKIDGTDDYVIKDSTMRPMWFNGIKQKSLLLDLKEKQPDFDNIEFPIGYYLNNEKIKGTIIPYYPDSMSLRRILNTYDNKQINDYYLHSEDELDNLIILCLDILNMISSMYKDDIAYVDIHSGNFLFYNNEVKLIDFEPGYVFVTTKKYKHYQDILRNYGFLISAVLRKFGYRDFYYTPGDSFSEAEDRVLSLKKQLKRG